MLINVNAFSQSHKSDLSFKDHVSKANELNRINLFSESIQELERAIYLAKKNNNKAESIEAAVILAELMRRTKNYEKGLEILYSIQNSIAYPKLHVRKLGRMAAIYSEGSQVFEAKYGDKIKIKDSIEFFIDQSLKLAIKNKYKIEEANLRNELGLFLMRQNKRELAMSHLTISSKLFWEAKDTLNYISTSINVLENYLGSRNDIKFDMLSNQLIFLIIRNGTPLKRWFLK